MCLIFTRETESCCVRVAASIGSSFIVTENKPLYTILWYPDMYFSSQKKKKKSLTVCLCFALFEYSAQSKSESSELRKGHWHAPWVASLQSDSAGHWRHMVLCLWLHWSKLLFWDLSQPMLQKMLSFKSQLSILAFTGGEKKPCSRFCSSSFHPDVCKITMSNSMSFMRGDETMSQTQATVLIVCCGAGSQQIVCAL